MSVVAGSRTPTGELPSLFVVALPRSLSTWVFESARAALNLRSPSWTSAGEILNVERWAMLSQQCDGGRFTQESDRARFERWSCFLDTVVRPCDHAYKDVVQPFVTSRWLSEANGQSLRLLRVNRPLADVAWSMLEAGWHYPGVAAKVTLTNVDRVLCGLLQARAALAQLDAIDIDFDALIQGSSALSEALERLYPEASMHRIAQGNKDFRAHSYAILERRLTTQWRALAARIEELSSP
ncbi:hypothetical protein ACCQ05_20955 [Xanthomonas sp. NCPPB 3582]|uniref:hypothetical protein n=1 Tax=Xanthomonas sp. NCPPB 3582 TaxID=487557 RepID=UPI003558FC14